MNIRYLSVILTIIVTALFPGCATSPGYGPDQVKILEVMSAPIPGSDLISYKVKVRYSLGSSPKGKVLLGFDSEDPGSYKMVGEASVERGAGETEVVADIKRPNRSAITVYVNLSEDPHPMRWTPLANDTRQVLIMR